MEPLSAFEIAQQRLEARQTTRTFFFLWLGLFVALIGVSIFGGSVIQMCMLPIAGLAGLVAVWRGIVLYYSDPRRSPSPASIEQEMEWLYGEDWRETSGTDEFACAQDRIRKRLTERWRFLLHLISFVAVNTLILPYLWPSGLSLYPVPLIWLVIVGYHFTYAFPLKRALERRERAAGQSVLRELNALQYGEQKTKRKPKRETHFVLADDGELVEVADTLEDTADKPKRLLRS